MIAFLRRLFTRQPSELEQMRRNRDYWRKEALRLQERLDMAYAKLDELVGRHDELGDRCEDLEAALRLKP